MTKRQRTVAWSTLAAGVLALAATLTIAFFMLQDIAEEMRTQGWWNTVTASTLIQFLGRCELFEADCRTALNGAFRQRFGSGQYAFIFSSMLLVAGVVLVAPKPPRPYTSHFARLADVWRLYISFRDRYAIPLIRLRGRLLGVKQGLGRWSRHKLKHILVEAPTQSGKSVLAKSVLGTFGGSAVLVDLKGELFKDTSGFRKFIGPTYVLHPRGYGHRYDPIADLAHDSAALRAAAELLVLDPKEDQRIFADRAVPAIVAALRAAQLQGEPAIPYLRHLTLQGPVGFVETLSAIDDETVRHNLTDYLAMRPEEFDKEALYDPRGFIASSWGTLTTRLSPFFEPGIRTLMSGNDFRAADLAARPTNLYLTWPEELAASSAKPLSLLLHGLVTGMARDADRKGKGVPTLLLLDEAPSYPIPSLPTYLATLLGRGIAAMIFVQSEEQLRTSYQRAAQTIIDNCAARLFFSIAPSTAKRLSEELGLRSVTVQSRQRGDNRVSEHHYQRPLMTPDELTRLPEDEALLLVRGERPVRGKRVQWFRDRTLKRRLRFRPLPVDGVVPVKES